MSTIEEILNYIVKHIISFILFIVAIMIIYVVERISNYNAIHYPTKK